MSSCGTTIDTINCLYFIFIITHSTLSLCENVHSLWTRTPKRNAKHRVHVDGCTCALMQYLHSAYEWIQKRNAYIWPHRAQLRDILAICGCCGVTCWHISIKLIVLHDRDSHMAAAIDHGLHTIADVAVFDHIMRVDIIRCPPK